MRVCLVSLMVFHDAPRLVETGSGGWLIRLRKGHDCLAGNKFRLNIAELHFSG
jgi:hypothetical protein